MFASQWPLQGQHRKEERETTNLEERETVNCFLVKKCKKKKKIDSNLLFTEMVGEMEL